MRRVLVVAYSRTGTTRQAAEAIALHCDADIEWIKDRDPHQGLMGYLRRAAKALARSRPWIQPPRRAPEDYALVIVGTPVWAANMASPVRSYLARYGARCRRVAFFCTHDGMGADRVLADMQVLCGRRALATLALPRSVVDQGLWYGPVASFARRFAGQRGERETTVRLAA